MIRIVCNFKAGFARQTDFAWSTQGKRTRICQTRVRSQDNPCSVGKPDFGRLFRWCGKNDGITRLDGCRFGRYIQGSIEFDGAFVRPFLNERKA